MNGVKGEYEKVSFVSIFRGAVILVLEEKKWARIGKYVQVVQWSLIPPCDKERLRKKVRNEVLKRVERKKVRTPYLCPNPS